MPSARSCACASPRPRHGFAAQRNPTESPSNTSSRETLPRPRSRVLAGSVELCLGLRAGRDSLPSSLACCWSISQEPEQESGCEGTNGPENPKWMQLAAIWSSSHVVARGLGELTISGLAESPGDGLSSLSIQASRRLSQPACSHPKEAGMWDRRSRTALQRRSQPGLSRLPCLLGMLNIPSVMLKSSVVCCCPL